ncbi:MAG: DUF3179 domain-containing (seleno)protein [Actinomycetota bacterium]
MGASGGVFPPAPPTVEGDLAPAISAAVESLVAGFSQGLDFEALEVVASSGDSRVGWVVADLLRFYQIGTEGRALIDAFGQLTGAELESGATISYNPWQSVTDHLIAWDVPAPPGYQQIKGRLFVEVEAAWRPFFGDPDATVDWRHVSWGGVFIDARPLGRGGFCPRGCIPALDDPPLTKASAGGWYPDGNVVFGVVVEGVAVAFPKQLMEVHEMVILNVGGRRLGIPYCTLCGSAQAYFLDRNPGWGEEMVLRTSGLLSRSNKMMYELGTFSLIDTFTGVATSGPLLQAGVTLEQTTVVASLWGGWKQEHPDTMIVAEDGGLGRAYPDDPLQGRDAAGPIFPIGDVDSRLTAQALVIGVVNSEGTPVAFLADAARTVTAEGGAVAMAGVILRPAGTGFTALTDSGETLVAHQACWFAWSQFQPDTLWWEAP